MLSADEAGGKPGVGGNRAEGSVTTDYDADSECPESSDPPLEVQLQSESKIRYQVQISISRHCSKAIADVPGDDACTPGAKDPWSYLHAEEAIARRAQRMTEALPLAEFIFRYDCGDFRVGPFTFEYFNVPFNNSTCWWLDDFLHTRMMY